MIKAEEFKKRTSFCGNPMIVDVRTKEEFSQKHLKNAINIPLSDIEENKDKFSGYDGIYLYCASGKRSKNALSKVTALGVDFVVSLDGGIDDLEKIGMEVEGGGGISIMRQVQIIAGLLILLGVAMSYYIDHIYILISGFVGLGLLVAGISNTCAMAQILSKMPWNK